MCVQTKNKGTIIGESDSYVKKIVKTSKVIVTFRFVVLEQHAYLETKGLPVQTWAEVNGYFQNVKNLNASPPGGTSRYGYRV